MATTSSPSTTLHSMKTLEHSRVSPPKGSVPETSIPLNSFDVLWLTLGAIERLFFFKLPFSTSHFISHHLLNLRSSLSLTLQHFFPLAGHLRQSPSSPDHYEIHYTDGDSVSLFLAESAEDFQHLSGHQPKDFKKLLPLIPTLSNHESKPAPLMALQLTLFPNHDALCLGVTIKHVVADGNSFINFIKSWAATNLSGAPTLTTPPPLLHRDSVTGDTENLYSINLEAAGIYETKLKRFSANVDSPEEDVVFATFSLNREVIKKIRSVIMRKYGGITAPFHCSTFVVACAYMWTCLIRSRRWPSERTAHFVFAVDARARVTPAISPSYFGNYLSFCFTEVKVGDVIEGDHGVHLAAEVIGKAIDELIENGVLRGADEWPEKFRALASKTPMSIAGSPKLGVYGIDFGWGKPVKVEVTTIRETGAMSMAENGGEEGGLEFGLAFPKDEMDAFQACFASGLQLL